VTEWSRRYGIVYLYLDAALDRAEQVSRAVASGGGKLAFRRGTIGGDELSKFFRRGTFRPSLSSIGVRPPASAPSRITNHVIRRFGPEARPCSTSTDDAVCTVW